MRRRTPVLINASRILLRSIKTRHIQTQKRHHTRRHTDRQRRPPQMQLLDRRRRIPRNIRDNNIPGAPRNSRHRTAHSLHSRKKHRIRHNSRIPQPRHSDNQNPRKHNARTHGARRNRTRRPDRTIRGTPKKSLKPLPDIQDAGRTVYIHENRRERNRLDILRPRRSSHNGHAPGNGEKLPLRTQGNHHRPRKKKNPSPSPEEYGTRPKKNSRTPPPDSTQQP